MPTVRPNPSLIQKLQKSLNAASTDRTLKTQLTRGTGAPGVIGVAGGAPALAAGSVAVAAQLAMLPLVAPALVVAGGAAGIAGVGLGILALIRKVGGKDHSADVNDAELSELKKAFRKADSEVQLVASGLASRYLAAWEGSSDIEVTSQAQETLRDLASRFRGASKEAQFRINRAIEAGAFEGVYLPAAEGGTHAPALSGGAASEERVPQSEVF